MTPTDQPSETESVPIGSKSVDQPSEAPVLACRGSYALGTACRKCYRCHDEWQSLTDEQRNAYVLLANQKLHEFATAETPVAGVEQGDYIQFGPEWEKETLKLSKANIVGLLRSVGKERIEIRAELQSAKEALVKTERGLMDVLPIGEHTLESIPSVIKQLVDACAELRRDSETWRHVLEMVRANGFESVGQVLVQVDSLRQELEKIRGEG